MTRSNVMHLALESLLFDPSLLLFDSLLVATLAILWIRLRKPRPPLRDLVRQPGLVACLASALGYWLYIDLRYFLREKPLMLHGIVGGAVAVAWLVQALARRWRPESSWVDRLGRAVGFGWLATILGFLAISALDRY